MTGGSVGTGQGLPIDSGGGSGPGRGIHRNDTNGIHDIDDLTGTWHLAAPCPGQCPTITVLLAGCEVDIHEGHLPERDTDE